MAQKHNSYEEKPMTRFGSVQGPSRRYRRLRHPTFPAAEWADKNPLLQRGEFGIEIDTHRVKAGDGITYWNDLPYVSDVVAHWGDIVGDIDDQTDLKNALDSKANSADLATVATSGDYDDLLNKPTIGDATLTVQKNGTDLDTFTANATTDKTINITVPVTASDVNALPDTTKYVANASMTINSTTYVVTLQLKDQDGNNIGTAQTIDLPLESVVVSGSYDSATKEVVLTLQNGSTIRFSVADLVSGLQTEITANNMLDADLVDDSTSTNKFVTSSDITTWNAKQDALTAGSNITISGTTISATDTTYTGSDGITLTGTNFTNSGVRSVSTGSTNGTISVNTNGTSADVSVYGLGSAAYTASTDYATSAQGAKADTAVQPGDLATVATTGDYDDLLNKPTIPAAQVNSDWNANSGVAEILNKPTLGTMAAESASDYTPTASLAAVALSGAYSDLSGTPSLATVATSGSYNDLLNKPTIPTVNNATLTIQKNGTNVATFTANASSGVTANISVPTDTNDLTNGAGYITGITSGDVTTALGYTPYSDANPNGYTSNVGTVTSVNSVSPDGSGNVSLTIPTVNNPTITITQGGVIKGSFTLNQVSGDTIALDAGGGNVTWGNISGTLSSQTDLQNALDAKQATITGAATTIASSNLAAARAVISNSTGKIAVSTVTSTELGYLHGTTSSVQTQLNNKANSADLATVATSGSYNDLINKPTIPTVNNPTITITQGGVTKGSFTLNQASGDTIALDAGGGSSTLAALSDVSLSTPTDGQVLTYDNGDWVNADITSGYHPDIFDWKWADHQLNDVSWLRADTFSWQSGAVYQAAYQHLVDDIDGKTLQSETISGTTIQFYLADDGHKICPASEESNVAAIYTATGVAWYYILDTVNQRFKLPRTQFSVTGLRDTVGKYVGAGLPNITGGFNTGDRRTHINDATGAFYRATASSNLWGAQSSTSGNTQGVGFDASLSNSIYGNSTTVQPQATQMYLYFYVGQFTQTAIQNTAGLNAELFNDKADKDFGNTTMIDYVVEKQDPSAGNNYTWYRKYKSGWVEQGGYVVLSGNTNNSTMNLPVTMSDTNYIVELTKLVNQNFDQSVYAPHVRVQNTTNFTYSYNTDAANSRLFWQVSGIAA